MAGISPTLEGFRAAFRRPSLTFAEMAWRWTVGAVACTLFLFSFIEYLDTLPVTHGDATLLSTRQPLLVGRAISHILRGSLNRAVFAVLFEALALALLWIIVASLGRAATVRALITHFRRDVNTNTDLTGSVHETADEDARDRHGENRDSVRPCKFRALLTLNFLRVAVALAALLAFAGAAILASFTSSAKSPQPGMAFILFLLLAGLIFTVWPVLNWILSLASIFSIRDGADALEALAAAGTFSRDRAGPVFAVSTWTGIAHLVALSVAGTAVSLPLAFIQFVPPRLIIAAIVLLTLAYFAIVDWLHIARLAGYVCIAELPDSVAIPALLSAPPSTGEGPLQSAMDLDEPILSDLPNLALDRAR
jgi:hypothetical protein